VVLLSVRLVRVVPLVLVELCTDVAIEVSLVEVRVVMLLPVMLLNVVLLVRVGLC